MTESESQRDSGPKPGAARDELPSVQPPIGITTPTGLRLRPVHWGGSPFTLFSQGSSASGWATLLPDKSGVPGRGREASATRNADFSRQRRPWALGQNPIEILSNTHRNLMVNDKASMPRSFAALSRCRTNISGSSMLSVGYGFVVAPTGSRPYRGLVIR